MLLRDSVNVLPTVVVGTSIGFSECMISVARTVR
jgi:hypothetical protein